MAAEGDHVDTRDRLEAWLSDRMPFAGDATISDLNDPDDGEANRTLLVAAVWKDGDATHHEELVVRLSPPGSSLFKGSDLRFQWDVMETVAATSSVPVPKLWRYEPDDSVLGAPFYVMSQVPGKVPNQYTCDLFEQLAPDERLNMYRNGLEALVQIHAIDHTTFDCLDTRRTGAPGLGSYLAYVEEWYVWAARGREFPSTESGLRWLRERQPRNTSVSFIWGDSRPGNLIIRPEDQSVAAVLDWEVAAVAAPEADLAWWLMFEVVFSNMGVPVPDGVPDRDATLAMYEQFAGHTLTDMTFFDVLAWCRLAITFIGYVDASAGTEREEQSLTFNAFVTDQLRRRISSRASRSTG